MKRAFSILLLVLFLYNLLGYYVIFYFQNLSLQQEITHAIDNGQISDDDLILIKVPVPVYHQNDKDFERVEGNFEHQGRFYELVKRKIANDTIYTYCLTDEKKEQLHQKLSEHVQTHVADVKGTKPVKSEKHTPSFIKEYLQVDNGCVVSLPLLLAEGQKYSPYLIHFSAVSPSITTPPPRKA